MSRECDTFERVVLCATLLTLVLALVSWVQMRLGMYALDKAFVAAAACSGLLFFAVRRTLARGPAWVEPPPAVVLAAVTVLGFGALYAKYPTYFLLGGQDPGPYLAFAARIAKTGGLDPFVPEIQRWAAAHEGLARTFPAVYGDVEAPGASHVLHPQFVHLFTAYLANFWAAGGVQGAVRANAWLAVLCLAVGFVVLRRLGSLGAALTFVVALGVNPAFVWASRITLTEMLGLLLNLTGLMLLLLAWDLESKVAGVLAGGVLGLGVLNRLDGGLNALAITGFAAATLLEGTRRRHIAALGALVHLALTSFGYFDGQRLAPEYWHDLERGSRALSKLISLTTLLDLTALVLSLGVPRFAKPEWANETRLRLAGYALLVGVGVWIGYGLTLRPLGDDLESGSSMLELTWYLSWVAWPLGLAGLACALGYRSFQRWLPLWLLTVGPLIAFTAQTEIAHEHIWASRRWVPQVIPCFLAVAAYGGSRVVAALRSRASRFVATGLVAVPYLLTALGYARAFLFESMLAGVPAAYEKVAEYAKKNESRWPLVTNNVLVGSILTYAYEIPTVLLNDRGAQAAAQGAFVGALGVGFDPFGLRHASAVDARIAGRFLERRAEEPPSAIIDLHVPLEVGEFGPRTFDLEIPAAHLALRTRGTTRTEQGELVVSPQQRGPVLWGPWIDLPAGRYRAEWYGSVGPGKRKRRGTLDVIYEKGAKALASMPLEELPAERGVRLLGGLDFTLPEATPAIEFRVRIDRSSAVTLARLRLQRFAP